MFSGASNVKIFGGNFRQINGAYNHYEYKTTVSNYNSNNVTGNTLTETYNDNSQEFHGVNAKGREYVRALRHGSARPQQDTSVPEHPSISTSDPASTAEPVLSIPASEPEAVNLLAQPSAPTTLRVPHSKVSYASHSFGPGDVRAMQPRAAAHFIAAFELMEQEDVAEDEALPDLPRGSRENPIPVDDNDNESTALRHSDSSDDPSQCCADERSNACGHVLETPEIGRPASHSYIPIPSAMTPPHEFHSQKLEPTSTYSHLAHNMRNVVTDAIIRTHSDTHSIPTISLHTTQHPPSGTVQADEREGLSNSDKSSHSIILDAGASHITPPSSNAPADSVSYSQTIFNGPYTEINHDNRTVNYPGSGIVSNNVIQTSYKTSSSDGRMREKSEAETQDVPSLKVDEPRGRRKRQSKYSGRRI